MERKRKLITGITAIILALMMIFSLLASIIPSSANERSELNALKSKLSKVTGERKEIASQLSSLNAQMNSMLNDKMVLEQEINLTYEQITITEEIIASLDASIEKTSTELDTALADEERQYELFKTRLRTMYEQDSMTTLDLVFSASSFTEYLSRMQAASSIASYDKNLIRKLADTRAYIEDLKLSLEEDRADNENQRLDLETYKQDLDHQNAELDLVIADIESQTALTQDELDLVTAEEKAFEKEIAELAEKIRKQEEEAARKAAEANKANQGSSSASKYTGGDMTWPLPGHYNITSDFSMRVHPITKKYSSHTGIDVSAPKGTSIVAAAGGTVVTVGYNTAYGNRVIINHGGGIQTLYAHLSAYNVKENQTVSAGDVIGYVGSTGYSTGNHLHFSVLVNGSYVDPKPYVQG